MVRKIPLYVLSRRKIKLKDGLKIPVVSKKDGHRYDLIVKRRPKKRKNKKSK